MNKIMIFENEEFGKVRTIEEDGRILFCGVDITKALGYGNSNAALSRHCKGITKRDTLTNGGIQALSYITEGDVYRLIAHSRLPSAERFEKWVFDDVLPTIRKKGGYVANPELFVETFFPSASPDIKATMKLVIQHSIELERQNALNEPKIKFADQVADTANVIDMGEMAKLANDRGIRIGRNRLFSWLRVMGILMMNNIPYQEYMDRGYFKLKESLYYTDGVYKTRQTTYVTGKGQRYIIDRLLRDYASEVYEIA